MDGDHIVVTVGPGRADGKLQVHLRRRSGGHGGHRGNDAPMITVTPNGLAFAIRLAPYGSGLLWWLTGTLGPGLTGGGDPGEVRDGERFPAGAGSIPAARRI